MAQTVKNLPAIQETRIQSLGQEDPLEKGMTTHPSILAWRSPWTEEPGGLQSMGSQRLTLSGLLIEDACKRCKWAGDGALPQGLSGLQFYNQRKLGERKRPPSSRRHQALHH